MKVLGAAKERREQLDKEYSVKTDAEERDIMLEIFEKKMQMEFLKFGFLANKISLLQKGEALDSVEEVLQQMNTDHSIYDMENEIFELETAKAKHQQQMSSSQTSAATMKKISVANSTLLTPLQIKLKEVISNPEEQTLVKTLLDDASTFESKKAKQFVQKFTAHAEKKASKEKKRLGGLSKRMSYLERSSDKDKEKERDKRSDSERDQTETLNVREFIAALADHIFERHFENNPELDCDAIEIELEQHILPQIYKIAFDSVEKPEEDAILMEKCKEFAYIGQHEMNITQHCQSPEKIPFVDSITKLRTIYFSLTPGKQLYGILNAAQSVYQTLQEYHPDVTVGGDDFMDIWLYVVLKANVRKLASVINFVREYANPTLMQGELGYYFSTLELAAAYIKEFTKEKTNDTSSKTTPVERNPPFLVCERAKHIDLVTKRNSLSLVKEKVVVSGYKMYVVEDWLFTSTKFHHAILFHTGREEDKAVLTVVKIKESKFVTVQEKAYYKSFFLQSDTSGFSLCHTDHGVLLVADEKKFLKYFLVPVPNGDYDQSLSVIRFNLTLKRCGYTIAKPEEPIQDSEKEIFKKLYQLSSTNNFEQEVEFLVKEIQIMLRLTGYLGANIEIDGVYTDVVLRAAQKFQRQFNREESSSLGSLNEHSDLMKLLVGGGGESSSDSLTLWPALSEDGLMSPDIVGRLRDSLSETVLLFSKIGYKPPKDPVQKHVELAEMIVEFQNAKRLTPTGSFSDKTIEAMKEANLQQQAAKRKQ